MRIRKQLLFAMCPLAIAAGGTLAILALEGIISPVPRSRDAAALDLDGSRETTSAREHASPFSWTAVAAAQDAPADSTCNALLEHGIYEYIDSRASTYYRREDHEAVCQRSREVASRAVGTEMAAQYALIGGSGSYSQERYNEVYEAYCRSARMLTESRTSSSDLRRTLSGPALAAWERCVASGRRERRGLSTEITSRMIGDVRVVDVSVMRVRSTPRAIVALGVEGEFTCEDRLWDAWSGRADRTAAFPLEQEERYVMRCRQRARPARCDEPTHSAGQIYVRFSGDSDDDLSIDLPAIVAGCPFPRCSLDRGSDFGVSPATWPAETQCRGIPAAARGGFADRSHAARWSCENFPPGEARLLAHLEMRGVASPSMPNNCRCSDVAANQPGDVRMEASFVSGDQTVARSRAVRPLTQSCTSGLSDSIEGTIQVPADGRFTVSLRVDECYVHTPGMSCRFAAGSSATFVPHRPARTQQ